MYFDFYVFNYETEGWTKHCALYLPRHCRIQSLDTFMKAILVCYCWGSY